MKIRQGFVSNSSSSSFLIAFPNDQEMNFDNLHRFLFNSDFSEMVISPYNNNDSFESKYAVESILSQIKSNGRIYGPDTGKVIDLNNVVEPFIPYNKYNEFKAFDSEENFEKYERYVDQMREKEIEQIKISFPNHVFYLVEYEDHDWFGSIMEHGDVLNGHPNIIRYSHH
jgi:hypothetical protein